MSIKHRLSMAFVCLTLLMGTMAGGPMPPEEIEKLLHASHQQEIAYVLEEEKGQEDDLKGDSIYLDRSSGSDG